MQTSLRKAASGFKKKIAVAKSPRRKPAVRPFCRKLEYNRIARWAQTKGAITPTGVISDAHDSPMSLHWVHFVGWPTYIAVNGCRQPSDHRRRGQVTLARDQAGDELKRTLCLPIGV
jgi:hypothetical protein